MDTPLTKASHKGHSDVVKELVTAEANINHQNKVNYTCKIMVNTTTVNYNVYI